MLTNFERIFKFAINDFSRNKGVSLAAIFILFVVIMLATSLLFFQGFASYLTNQIQNKIDITAYFKDNATEDDILQAKSQILKMSPDVKSVEYVSKEQALQVFNEKHKGNEIISQAIEEVGANPFLPSLNIITTGSTLQYEQISNILQSDQFSNLIDKVDFSEKKDTIEKVFSIVSNVNILGLILGIILIIIAVLVVYNTIRLAIDNSKDEISTMKIVGASNWFIRGPFIIQGAIYGAVAFIICFSFNLINLFFIVKNRSYITWFFSF